MEAPDASSVELPRYHLGKPPQPRLGTTAYRTSLPAGNSVSTRVAFVEDPGGPFIFEATTHVQAGFRWASIAAEVAGTAGASDRWSGSRFGNVVLDARFLFGGTVTAAVGLRGTVPLGRSDGANGAAAWWGTVPQATVPTTGLALAWEVASERWVWHGHLGGRADPWWANMYVFGIFDLDTSLATIQPVGARWSLVGEAELLNNAQTPLHLRALARRDLGRAWTVDAGLALPVVAFLQDPTLQVIGSLRWAP
jgi:hypothetical protein